MAYAHRHERAPLIRSLWMCTYEYIMIALASQLGLEVLLRKSYLSKNLFKNKLNKTYLVLKFLDSCMLEIIGNRLCMFFFSSIFFFTDSMVQRKCSS